MENSIPLCPTSFSSRNSSQAPDISKRCTMAKFDPIMGRYLPLNVAGVPQRIYVEEAGDGIPLVCLHTAGSDTRQFRGILNNAAILERFRVIAFDLPWHGKSSPPVGWQNTQYQ